jgi:hypothetical protein
MDKLTDLGTAMLTELGLRSLDKEGKLDKKQKEARKKLSGSFEEHYQQWYTESHAVILQLIPHRLSEFESLYKGEGRRKEINSTTYNIQDWLNGIRAGQDAYEKKYYDDFAIVVMRFKTQLDILKSIRARFESSLFDIKQLVQADLFDSELDTARELLKNGFLRPAGIVAGVVMESHLSQVCSNHGVTTKKKNPAISDFNDLLKKNNVFDVPQWRFIQRLGDLRNLCAHKGTREPTKDEVAELIDGVDKITKTLF